jgi:hypothetical protein
MLVLVLVRGPFQGPLPLSLPCFWWVLLVGAFGGAFALGVAVFGFLAVALLSSSFAFLLVPAAAVFFVSVFTGATCAASLLVAPFFASRSFFVHSFLNLVSSLLTLAWHFEVPCINSIK